MPITTLRHGHSSKTGCTPTYYSWRNMLTRVRGTSNRNDREHYHHVDVDPRWLVFENFLTDMGERPTGRSLDRKDSTKGYWPENCRWATRAQQSRNSKISKLNTSGVAGVVWLSRDNRWRAQITVDHKPHYLGTFDTVEQAITARKAGEVRYWGDER